MQAFQNRADLPRRVEALRVEIRDRQAEASRGLEAPAGGVHADRGRGERVSGGEEEGAPVLAVVVGRVGGAGDNVVPF